VGLKAALFLIISAMAGSCFDRLIDDVGDLAGFYNVAQHDKQRKEDGQLDNER
jgi:hypothetical protein